MKGIALTEALLAFRNERVRLRDMFPMRGQQIACCWRIRDFTEPFSSGLVLVLGDVDRR